MRRRRRIDCKPPRLVVLLGPPGSGKTTIASALLERVVAVHLDKDGAADSLTRDRGNDLYRSRVASRAYAAIYGLAALNLPWTTVILDSPFNDLRMGAKNARLDQLVEESRALLRVVYCSAPDEEIMQRLRQRGLPRDAHKISRWDEYIREAHAKAEIAYDHLVVDTTKSLEENIESIIAHL